MPPVDRPQLRVSRGQSKAVGVSLAGVAIPLSHIVYIPVKILAFLKFGLIGLAATMSCYFLRTASARFGCYVERLGGKMLNEDRVVPSLRKSIATGAIGFSLVSLCVFATVAFAERWMYRNLGVLGSYVAWTALFVALSGAVFGSLVVGRWRLPRFYLLWALAFFVYAAAWMLAYFSLCRTTGEVVGSLAGSVLIAVVLAGGFNALRSVGKVVIVIFVANALGYFL